MRRHAVIFMNLCVVLAFAGPISIARAQDGVVVAWGNLFVVSLSNGAIYEIFRRN